MPPAKKATKKVTTKHAPDHALKDERRAYEHRGRVENLDKYLEKGAAKEITRLTDLAKQELEAGHMKDAADLLRAAEHLSFGSMHAPRQNDVHPKLAEELAREFEGKLQKAGDHWSDDEAHLEGLETIFTSMKERAQKAFDEGSYWSALELARAAEALAHVKSHDEARADEEDDAETKKD